MLRQFSEADLENVFLGLSHPDVIRYYGIHYDTLEATKTQMIWFSNLEKTGTGLWWAICDLNNQRFFGAGGFNNVHKDFRKAEIGFWLMPPFWGQGIMKEAMPLICQYGFEKMGLHRIEGFVETENQHCKKAISKIGFEYEGTMRDCETKNGRYISLDIYAKINDG
ncbi:MAG TPA: GNAT family N-acetyltransferase [Niabella sp.]|nr:GNAT family N-acetyltransferase [Niabella sp.]